MNKPVKKALKKLEKQLQDPQTRKLWDLMTREEELIPELKAAMYENPSFGPSIHHPLVISIAHHPSRNAMVNESYRKKLEYAREMLDQGKLSAYVWIHERPYRLQAFLEHSYLVGDRAYWSLLRDIWLDSENIYQNLAEWVRLLDVEPDEEGYLDFMNEDDRAAFDKLPDVLEVHRGHTGLNEKGLSYTLDRAKAEWFSKRFTHRGQGRVLTRKIPKSAAFAFLGGRGESEVVIKPAFIDPDKREGEDT